MRTWIRIAILVLLALVLAFAVSCRNQDLSGERLPSHLRKLALGEVLDLWREAAVRQEAISGRPVYRGALLVSQVEGGYFAIVNFGPPGTWACLFLQDEATGKWSFLRQGHLEGTGGLVAEAPSLPPEGLWAVRHSEKGLWGVLGDRAATRVEITAVSGAASQVPDAVARVENGVFFVPIDLPAAARDYGVGLRFMDDSGIVVGAGTYQVGPYGQGAGHYRKTLMPFFGTAPWRRLEADAVTFSEKGRLSYVCPVDGGWSLVVCDCSGAMIEEALFDNPVAHPVLSPDGNFIALVEAQPGARGEGDPLTGRALVIDLATKEQTDLGLTVDLGDERAGPSVFSWSPGGQVLLVNGLSVAVWRPAGASLEVVAEEGPGWRYGALSAEGDKVAILSQAGARRTLTVHDLRTGGRRELYSGQAAETPPGTPPAPEPVAWSGPSSVVFLAVGGPGQVLASVDLSSGRLRTLAEPVCSAWLSPDGARVALAAEQGGSITVSDLQDGTRLDLGLEGDVVWAPDGTALLVWTEKQVSVYRLTAVAGCESTGLLSTVVTDARFAGRPVWFDRSLAAVVQRGGGRSLILSLSGF